MLASPRRAKSDKHLDKGNPVGSDFHFGMVGLPKLGVKGGVYTLCIFERRKESKGNWISEAVGWR